MTAALALQHLTGMLGVLIHRKPFAGENTASTLQPSTIGCIAQGVGGYWFFEGE